MTKWLVPNTKSKIPCYSTHNLAVGGVVFSPCATKILVVISVITRVVKEQWIKIKEKFGRLKSYWKFPGGLVDEGETLEKAAVREVFEETGINAKYLGILGFREQLNFRFGQGDFYFPCLMRAQSTHIVKQEEEIQEAQWADIASLNYTEFYAMHGEVVNHVKQAHHQNPTESLIKQLEDCSLTSAEAVVLNRPQNYHLSQMLRNLKSI